MAFSLATTSWLSFELLLLFFYYHSFETTLFTGCTILLHDKNQSIPSGHSDVRKMFEWEHLWYRHNITDIMQMKHMKMSVFNINLTSGSWNWAIRFSYCHGMWTLSTRNKSSRIVYHIFRKSPTDVIGTSSCGLICNSKGNILPTSWGRPKVVLKWFYNIKKHAKYKDSLWLL